ncbi:MAG: hypothetical protein K9G76_03185 [Bacteroidales bacterium]|nr:hypothetical protein [Bacteroidales bacterium]MCF8402796.1 hypothetical protein [Bacteroidales bacterium]
MKVLAKFTIAHLPKKESLVFLSICILFIIPNKVSYCQDSDSLKSIQNKSRTDTTLSLAHSPHKASLYSMVLPGLGQAYNKKYWKIPVVYAGFGVFYYLIKFNDKEYKAWRAAYYHNLNNIDGTEPPINEYEEKYGDDPEFLKANKDFYRRNRDLNYILTGLWYMLNVVDATVDAHLYTWEVDENLSIRVEPQIYNGFTGFKPAGGLKLSLRF